MQAGNLVFKIAPRDAWDDAVACGIFYGSADDLRDGFVHMSTAGQVAGTLAKHFRDETDLVLIAFDAHALGDTLKWDASRDGALFPHHYGPLPAEKALWVKDIATGADGVPVAPGGTEP